MDKNKKQNDLNLSKASEKENSKKYNNKSLMNFYNIFFSNNND